VGEADLMTDSIVDDAVGVRAKLVGVGDGSRPLDNRDVRGAPRSAVVVPNAGAFADPRRLARLARDAEQAGWDGFFVWDTLVHEDKAVIDPWIALAAVATTTRRVRIGTMVASAARRRPWKLAREAATLDRLSRGRLILGLGAGYRNVGFTAFGEDAKPRVKFGKLDETMSLLDAFFSGERVRHHGAHYHVESGPFLPRPMHGRIPLWIALSGTGESELARASRADGVLGAVDLENIDIIREYVRLHRTRREPFDVVLGVHEKRRPADAQAFARAARDAGATWIRYKVGSIVDSVDDPAAVRRFVRRGPPS
jgi:alkanesulfonate monooxygenase SsuD/methylene tetrahydromethanopterin reductase-like flavin-dependent oxidoreductase (luciferase family)